MGTLALTGLVFMLPGTLLAMAGQTSVVAGLRESMGSVTAMVGLTAVSSVLSLILTPFMYTVMAVIYFDLRSRQAEEPFTPYVLALELGGERWEGVAGPGSEAEETSADTASGPNIS
jgi:hypothetical protein